jgi:hypothetical protein
MEFEFQNKSYSPEQTLLHKYRIYISKISHS